MRNILIWLGILGFAGSGASFGAGRGDEVVVVYNSRVPESKGVAEHYASMRQVPEAQVLGLDLPDSEAISRGEFRERLQRPLTRALEAKGLLRFDAVITPATKDEPRKVERKVVEAKVRYLALCYGVPLLITKDSNLHEAEADKLAVELRRNEAAVDSELACLPVLDHMMLTGPRANPFYGTTNAAQMNPTNGILLVTRLDGPSAEIARGLVDKAMDAESNGLWGRAYFDARGLTNKDPAKVGDDWIIGAAHICRNVGFETVLDTNWHTFRDTFPLSQVAFYAGWYDENVSGPFARPTVEFMPGAFAYHLHSFSATTLRSTKRQWAGPLLDRGAAATMGCVDEPYLGGTPNMEVFFARFILNGFSYGEAAYAAQNFVSWQITVVGDPLYRPFGKSPAELERELQASHSKSLEWEYLRLANFNLLKGMSLNNVVTALENVPMTRTSAVLEEKLAQLYHLEGKPSSSAEAYQQALKLDATPQQRLRIMQILPDRLIALGQNEAAYEIYQKFVKEFPDYPEILDVYRNLADLAQKLGHKDDAAKYQRQIGSLTEPHVPPTEKGPPQRHGT